MPPILENVCHAAKKLVRPGDRVAVAVSGGADSVALLEALLRLRERLAIEVSVAHFNHHLRGQESDDDEKFVKELAARYSLECYCGNGEVAARKGNVESIARELRYEFLRSLVESKRATKAATGHTADDQAETVVARLLRGSGTRGLAGIHACVDAWLVRPLLGIRREPLRAWLAETGGKWREDSSNRSLRFTRNRIRAEVMPVLDCYNPRLVEHLSQTAVVALAEEEYWRRHVQKLLPQLIEKEERIGETILKLRVAAFVQLSEAEQRRLLREVARLAGCAVQLDVVHIEALHRLAVSGQSGQQVDLGEWKAVRVFDWLEFQHVAEAAAPYEFSVAVPGSCLIPRTGTRLCFNLVGPTEADSGYNNCEEFVCDLGSIQNPLTVRNWRPGDTFDSPTGQGIRKIKNLLAASRVPAQERQSWPVVVSGDRVIWVRGFPVARSFRRRLTSEAGVLIREVPAKPE